jgi:intracellular multiplication protein IcmV
VGVFSTVKKAAGHMVDLRVDKWLGWDYIANTTKDYKNIVEGMATPEKAEHIESFDEAMVRLGLTNADVAQRKKEFTRLFLFFIGLSVAIIGYGLFMAVKGHMLTALISFCISIYSLTQAFRFNFWLFQIKNHKLGCTIQEWMNGKTFDPIMEASPKKRIKKSTNMKPGSE